MQRSSPGWGSPRRIRRRSEEFRRVGTAAKKVEGTGLGSRCGGGARGEGRSSYLRSSRGLKNTRGLGRRSLVRRGTLLIISARPPVAGAGRLDRGPEFCERWTSNKPGLGQRREESGAFDILLVGPRITASANKSRETEF